MPKTIAIRNAITVLGFAMLLWGCQSMQSAHTQASLENTGFMATWGVYRHCQVGTDVDTMGADLKQLRLAASKLGASSSFSLPLPETMKQMVEKQAQAPRLAVDPNAMAAACALSAGHVALLAERMDLATELFQSVIENHVQPEYAYYTAQARIGLNQVEQAVQVARHPAGAPVAITISAVSPTPGSKLPVSSAD